MEKPKSEAVLNINPSFVFLRLRATTAASGLHYVRGGKSVVGERGQLLESRGQPLNKT